MPDGLVRLHHSGQAHFLTFSCFQRLPLLAQMRMEDGFLCALEQVRRRFRMCVFGYVVMPEHVHLLVNGPALGTIADVLQLLKTKVSVQARKEQKRQAGDEPFWQARYFDHNVRNRAGFVTQLRYIHRNPVKRGLCAVRRWIGRGPASVPGRQVRSDRSRSRMNGRLCEERQISGCGLPPFPRKEAERTGHGTEYSYLARPK
jgi:putative transposase